ncbi:MAG: sensor histidine kinase [Gammaproteobacteria bacterium]
MKSKINNIQKVINNAIVLFVFIILIIFIFLIWSGAKQYNDFRGYQESISLNSITNAAGEINQYLREKKRLVVLFVNDNLELINKISNNPDVDSVDYAKMEKNVKRYFPDYFTFTITDNLGTPVTVDFDGKIGEVCLSDLNVFLNDDILLTRVHPNSVAYHFDIITRWSAGTKTGLFFVSFHTRNLGRLINLAQIPKHNILVVNEKQGNLIEITKDGARINWDRDDYRLSENELSNKIADIEIPNTYWHMIDLVDDDLFTNYLYGIIFQSSIMLVFLLIVAVLIFIILRNGKTVLLNEEKYKNDFISIVSHELRTPLTSIIGSLDLVLGGVAGELNVKMKELISVAKNNSTRLKLLVEDLLDIQSIIYARMNYNKKPVNVVLFINKTIEDISSYEDKVSFKITKEDSLSEAYFFVDEYRLSQVMNNLLKNAIRYGNSGSVDIIVQKLNENIRISVTDHGDGIPEKYQSTVFDRFIKIEQHKDQNHMGVGLGLNLVKKIIEAHNGVVDFITTQGKGTTFYFEIPEYIGFVSAQNK